MKRNKNTHAKNTDENVITLCNACARDYYNSPDFYIKAVLPRTVKESCTKCDRKGYDYIITDKSKKNPR